jgi:hypothetical protein
VAASNTAAHAVTQARVAPGGAWRRDNGFSGNARFRCVSDVMMFLLCFFSEGNGT